MPVAIAAAVTFGVAALLLVPVMVCSPVAAGEAGTPLEVPLPSGTAAPSDSSSPDMRAW